MFLTRHMLVEAIYEALLDEGVYDQNILKAFFLAGGPGSGKSYVVSQLFGDNTGASLGLKTVNSDPAFELFLKQVGVDPADLASMPEEEFSALTNHPDSPRAKAKKLKNSMQKMYTKERLGVILDGTGANYSSVAGKKAILDRLGYDSYMIFVNTSLDTAQQRNSKRERKLPPELVKKSWKAVQENIGKFQTLFGSENILIIDKNSTGPLPNPVKKKVDKWLRAPVQNYIGKRWMEAQLAKKDRTKD